MRRPQLHALAALPPSPSPGGRARPQGRGEGGKGCTPPRESGQQGSVMLASVLVLMLLVFAATSAFLLVAATTDLRASRSHKAAQALNLAEAGIAKAVACLAAQGDTYRGEKGTRLGAGSFEVTVKRGAAGRVDIESKGTVAMAQREAVVREVEVLGTYTETANGGYTVDIRQWQQIEGGLEMEPGIARVHPDRADERGGDHMRPGGDSLSRLREGP